MMNTPRLTKRQAAIIGAYTGVTCGSFADIQQYADELMGEPTWTHQFGNKIFAEKLRELAKPDFLALCSEG